MQSRESFSQKSFREVMQAQWPKALPRQRVLRDPFFSRTVGDVLSLPRKKLLKELRLIPGSGSKSSAILLGIIELLRTELANDRSDV